MGSYGEIGLPGQAANELILKHQSQILNLIYSITRSLARPGPSKWVQARPDPLGCCGRKFYWYRRPKRLRTLPGWEISHKVKGQRWSENQDVEVRVTTSAETVLGVEWLLQSRGEIEGLKPRSEGTGKGLLEMCVAGRLHDPQSGSISGKWKRSNTTASSLDSTAF